MSLWAGHVAFYLAKEMMVVSCAQKQNHDCVGDPYGVCTLHASYDKMPNDLNCLLPYPRFEKSVGLRIDYSCIGSDEAEQQSFRNNGMSET